MAYRDRTDFTGLTDLYIDTAAYNIDPSFSRFLQDPRDMDTKRWNAYRYYMDFYEGRHWDEHGEWSPAFAARSLSNEEFNRRTWNVTKNIVDKLISFLVKEPWTVKLPEETEDADENVQKVLDAVWEANDKDQLSYDMAYMGCITGDCYFKVSYDEDFYAVGIGELKIQVLDSRWVLPFFDGQDRNKLVGARIQYPTIEIQADGSKKTVVYTEIHTDASIVTFIDGQVENVAPNPLGEMMVIHVKNEPLPYKRFGRSVVEDLIRPNKEFNEKTADLSEILAYHAAPITVVKGARINTLEKGARKVWGGIPKDGDVYNLNLEADLSSSNDYLDKLKQFIHETGSVPAETMSNLQEISNTSGSALHLQYQPILDRIARMQVNYGIGLKQINRIILKFYEAIGAIDLPEDVPPVLKYKNTIMWGDALPRDRSIDLADISTEMGLQLESRRGALKRLGETNVDAKLEEIDEEAMEQAQRDFMSAGLSTFGDPSAGPDGMSGATANGPPGTKTGANDGPQNDVQGAVKAAKTNPVTQGSQQTVQAVKKSAQATLGTRSKKP